MSLVPREFQDVAAGDSPLVIRVVCRRSLWGRLRSVLFRSPVLYLRVQTADGATYDRRVLPSLERSGFLLNPLLLTIDDWIDAYTVAGARQRVIRIQLCEPRGNNFYEGFDVEVDVLPTLGAPSIDGRQAAALHADVQR